MIDDERPSKLCENLKATLKPPSVSTDETSLMRPRLHKSDISLYWDQEWERLKMCKRGKTWRKKERVVWLCIEILRMLNKNIKN